jgi:hypothetical protein
METLTALAGVLSAFLTPVLAVTAGYIAWQQHRTARSKLKLDLYERRFRVYRGVMNLLGAVVRNGATSHDDLAKFYVETDEKRFLLDDSLCAYLTEIREKAVKLRSVGMLIDSRQIAEERRSQAIEKDTELLQWFETQIEQVAQRFMKYLGFKKNL